MKYFAAILALASAAVATPAYPVGCKPATYSCLPNNSGWQVCNTSGQWVFAGTCPPQTVCKFDTTNQSPYCVPPNFTIPA